MISQKVKVTCPSCGCALQVKRELAGKKVKCRCESVFRIGALPPPPAQVSRKVKFRCQSCSQAMQSDAKNVGQTIVCSCGSSIVITDGASQAVAPPVVQEAMEPLLIAEQVPDVLDLGHQDPLDAQNMYSPIEPRPPRPRRRPRGKVHRAPQVTTIFFVIFFGGISVMNFGLALTFLAGGSVFGLLFTLAIAVATGLAAVNWALYRVVVLPKSIEVRGVFGTRRIILSEVKYVEIFQSYGKFGVKAGKTWTFMGRGNSLLGCVSGSLGGFGELEAWVKRRFKCKHVDL